MALPLTPKIMPQLAKREAELPLGEQWVYEPKYDGFRAIVFVDDDGSEVEIQSRSGKPMRRYFPELTFPTGRYVIDGEIVIDDPDAAHSPAPQSDFGALQNRLHPAASRVAMLAEQTPARFIAFDVLAVGDEVVMERPLSERRELLETLVGVGGVISITPSTADPADCEPWLQHGEGVVAKDLRSTYKPGSRAGMAKIKRLRTIDCVVIGYRPGKEPGTVGSLILGLYDEDGELHGVGHSSGIKPSEKAELLAKLQPYESGARGHGDPSRWKSEKEMEWVGLRPELVVEITFDHTSGGRIRHGTKILRWRDDKPPTECALSQMNS
jgi:ATP-dependent DNA ligase